MKKVSLNLSDYQRNESVIEKIMSKRALSKMCGGIYTENYAESTYVRRLPPPTLPTKPNMFTEDEKLTILLH